MNFSELVYIDADGYHYPDYPTVLEWLQDQYRTIYGLDVYLEADSQDGQWVAIQAQAFYDCAALGASVYNSFSPATAQGAGLANMVKINGVKKKIATKSSCDVTIGGTVGTVITNGVAQDTNGNKWLLPSSVTIPDAGTIIVTATAENSGAVSAQAGTINKIFTPTRGWQTVTNVLAATPGAPVETDAELRMRQASSVAIPSLTVMEGTKGAVANVEGVTRSEGYENDTGSADSNGIPAHSISLVVEGGDSQEIADVIAAHKTPGTRTYGTTSVVAYDRYGVPNTINFYRPTVVPMKVRVTLHALAGYSSAYGDLIKAAVAETINALKIGQDVLITKLYVPANLPNNEAGATFDITTIEIAKVPNAFGTSNVVIAFNEAASCDTADITLVVT